MSPPTIPKLRKTAQTLAPSEEATATFEPPAQEWREGFAMAMRVLEGQQELGLEIEVYRVMNEEMEAAHADLAEASLRSLPPD